MDKYMGADDASLDDEARTKFEQNYSDLTTCMKRYPAYYKPILEQYEDTLRESLAEQISSSKD